jgi:hydrogenase/urease accessory protein HupE
MRRLLPIFLLLCVSLATPAQAHNLEFTHALLILKSDGSYQVEITADLDAFALGVSSQVPSEELAARLRAMTPEEFAAAVARVERTFARRVRIRFDGEVVPPHISFPEYGAAVETLTPLVGTEPTVLGLTARLSGRVPEDAAAVTFQTSRAFPPVQLTILDQRSLTGQRALLNRGEESAPYALDPAQHEAGDGTGADVPQSLAVAGQYLTLGFWHIVPEGLDHILFVLGLFLLAARWKPLLGQVTAFTAAHTVTLALSTYGVVRLSPAVVEPLIALSIAYVAIENLFTRELKPWRVALVFAFGLLHGLGFAGVLAGLGLPESERLPALLAFNGGVEIGQFVVLLVAFLLVGWFRDRPWYRQRVVIPISLAIALVGLYWAVTRTFGG